MITRRKFIRSSACASGLLLTGFSPLGANQMIHRVIPSSGEKIPVVGLGTWQTFDVGQNKAERNQRKQVFSALVEGGGSVIDSSPMYGSSESVVGDLISELDVRDKVFLATKVWTQGSSQGQRQMQQSIQRMKANTMDLMQVHNLVDARTHLDTLQQMKSQGTIRYMGITHYHSGGYTQMEKAMRDFPLDFIQINYSMDSRNAENRILPLALEKGIAVLINRPYEGGSLFRRTRNRTLPNWCSEFGCTSWGQFFLKFILSNPAVTCVIPGTSKVHHLKDNLQAGRGQLPDSRLREKMIQFL